MIIKETVSLKSIAVLIIGETGFNLNILVVFLMSFMGGETPLGPPPVKCLADTLVDFGCRFTLVVCKLEPLLSEPFGSHSKSGEPTQVGCGYIYY